MQLPIPLQPGSTEANLRGIDAVSCECVVICRDRSLQAVSRLYRCCIQRRSDSSQDSSSADILALVELCHRDDQLLLSLKGVAYKAAPTADGKLKRAEFQQAGMTHAVCTDTGSTSRSQQQQSCCRCSGCSPIDMVDSYAAQPSKTWSQSDGTVRTQAKV